MATLILGIGIGCFMYAFVNSRYNDKKWINSNYIISVGAIAIIIGIVMLL